MTRPIDHIPSPPPSLDSAGSAELTALTEQALQLRRRELELAIEKAFGQIPRPLRGVVHRMLGV